jgi:hypothetical protein
MQKPYHYVRLAPLPGDSTREILLVGGADTQTGALPEKLPDAYGQLEDWARRRWPVVEELVYCWTGQVYEPGARCTAALTSVVQAAAAGGATARLSAADA